MKHLLFKALGVLAIVLMVWTGSVWASGKMEVDIGVLVDFAAELDEPNTQFKWVAKKGAEIIATQTGRAFQVKFLTQGEYTVNLTATSPKGVKNTTINVLAGGKYARPVSSQPIVGGKPITEAVVEGGVLMLDGEPVKDAEIQPDGTVLIQGKELEGVRISEDGAVMVEGPKIGDSPITDAQVSPDGRLVIDGKYIDDAQILSDGSVVYQGHTLEGVKVSEDGKISVEPPVVGGVPVSYAGPRLIETDNGEFMWVSEGTDGETIFEAYIPPLKLQLETLPQVNENGEIVLLGENGKVNFQLLESTGAILEYRIDKNIFVDSDGNGTANDDIDNSDDDSYFTGKPWSADYISDESPRIAAEITLVDSEGKKVKEQVVILFEDYEREGDPVAFLGVSPAPDAADGLVHLYEDPHKVAFYARPSQGKILEYRIDKNTFADSNGDGNPANDIDNLNDISFKTGDVWETEYARTDKQIIAQLIAVGEGGKGSRIQRGIVFGDKPAPPMPSISSASVAKGIQLAADKSIVLTGDPVNFTVLGLFRDQSEYNYLWDLDGDGDPEQETEGIGTLVYIYDDPGVYEASVLITDMEGNSATKTLELTVREREVTRAEFTFETQGNTVMFTNNSTASERLSNRKLIYQWSFGDTDPVNFEEQQDKAIEENPEYSYRFNGNYLVTLTVTDSDLVTDSVTSEIAITDALPTDIYDEYRYDPGEEADAGEDRGKAIEPEGGEIVFNKVKPSTGSVVVKIFKFILYLVLAVIALVLLITGGLLVFIKVQHPELTFAELIDELRVKLLTMMGVHDMAEMAEKAEPVISPAHETPAGPEIPTGQEENPVTQSAKAEISDTEEKEAPPVIEQGPVPDWLKNADVIEGEEAEDEPVSEEPEADLGPASDDIDEEKTDDEDDDDDAPPADGSMPDWLNADK